MAPAAAASQLLDGLGPHVIVCSAMAPMQADELLEALIETALDRDVAMTVMLSDLDAAFAFLSQRAESALATGRLRLVVILGGAPPRLERYVDHVPNSAWDFCRLVSEQTFPVDIVVSRSGPETDGHWPLGSMVGYTPTAAAVATRIGLAVDPGVEALPGYPGLELSTRPIVCQAESRSMTAAASVPLDGTALQIGRTVASLLPDDATLQLGLGAIPDGVLAYLEKGHGYRLHSGILPPSTIHAVARGVFSGTPFDSTIVTTGLLGLGDHEATAVARDHNIRVEPIIRTHSPRRLLDISRYWAVNSAVEVDLTGQVNAEYAAGRRISSAGGQIDFARAAHLSPGGGSVIALPSRARNGAARIVARLHSPHVVATHRSDVDWIVTEYGSAHIAGLSGRERARALVEIAHPDDRGELSRHANGL